MRLLAACAIVVLAGCTAKTSTTQAPDLELTDVDGDLVRLQDWFGEPILLEVFGVHCSSCAAMMSQLVPFHSTHGERVHMMSVDLGSNFDGLGADDEAQVRAWRDEYGANWTFALDAPDHRTHEAYPHVARPTLYLIDSDAQIAQVFEGWTPVETLRAEADQLLQGEDE